MSREQTFRIAIRKFDPFESAIRKQWQAFEDAEKTGLTLEAEAFDLHPLQETLFVQQGLAEGHWDVAFLSTDWIAAVHEFQCVADLAPLLQNDPPEGYPRDWSQSLLRLQNVDGSVLGVPYHDGPECLIYRKDLFDDPAEQQAYRKRYGVPLTVPHTWSEFEQVARFFQRPDRRLYGTAFAAFPDGHNTVYDFLLQLWTRGGELFDHAGRIHFETPEALEALRFYRSMLEDNSATHPDCREMDSVQSGLAFAAGEIAVMVNWFGFAVMCETLAGSRVKGNVGVTLVPRGGNASSVSLNAYWILSIAARSPHRDIAYRFLRHCLSAPMDKLLTLEGATGCRKSTWKDAEVNASIPFYYLLESLHASARELPRLNYWPEIAALIDELLTALIQTTTPVAQLVREADRKASGIIARS
ncbi:MAG: extracellular solute-binding protein [Bryobacteraceae bacterium]